MNEDSATRTESVRADSYARRPGFRVRMSLLRNRLLASSRFHRWALRFPLTRAIARRRARKVFDLCAGFVYSQVLLACVQLRLFETLSERPLSIEDTARALGLPTAAAGRLLAAATSLGLVDRLADGRFLLGGFGAVVLGNPGIADMIRHHPLLYADLADPVALLRGERGSTELGRYWPYARSGAPGALRDEDVADYSALMASSQSLIADQVLDVCSLAGHRCLLDVGGGEGAFLSTVADRVPGLRMMLFDLPAVARRARQRFESAGLSERIRVVGGDFRSEPLPEGADVVSLVRILHDHDDDVALALARSVRDVLPEGGRLIVAEPMAATSGAEPIGDAYFGFYLLAMGSGRARSPSELCDLLSRAGFVDVRVVPTPIPMQTGVITARAGSSSGDERGAPGA